jgi:hypothetical protein
MSLDSHKRSPYAACIKGFHAWINQAISSLLTDKHLLLSEIGEILCSQIHIPTLESTRYLRIKQRIHRSATILIHPGNAILRISSRGTILVQVLHKIIDSARRNGFYKIVKCDKLSSAVCEAYHSGADCVLFSPASASFDAYENYKQRGEAFEKIFEEIKKSDPFASKEKNTSFSSSADRLKSLLGDTEETEKVTLEEKNGDKNFCRDCSFLIAHPFLCRCMKYNKEVNPMDDCPAFEKKKM